jgi:hypothetical protein
VPDPLALAAKKRDLNNFVRIHNIFSSRFTFPSAFLRSAG